MVKAELRSCCDTLLFGLGRVAVHSLKVAMREGKGRRHVNLAADDLDIRPGFTGACGLHRSVELPKRGRARRIPIYAS